LVVMFSASKARGSKGDTSYSFRAGTPLLHTSEGPARLLFLSPDVGSLKRKLLPYPPSFLEP